MPLPSSRVYTIRSLSENAILHRALPQGHHSKSALHPPIRPVIIKFRTSLKPDLGWHRRNILYNPTPSAAAPLVVRPLRWAIIVSYAWLISFIFSSARSATGLAGIIIGMIFFCQCPVSTFDLIVRCSGRYPKNFIRVRHAFLSPSQTGLLAASPASRETSHWKQSRRAAQGPSS